MKQETILRSCYSSSSFIECGCDEAGRGALAGPLFAAAVILPPDYHHPKINDSKKLSRKLRENLRFEIERDALAYAVFQVSEKSIDEMNILNATFFAMNQAVLKLQVTPELLLIDGNRFRNETGIPYHCIIGGDSKYLSIAAASILAKTYRDETMRQLSQEFPMYDWENNMGYSTKKHQESILTYGRCKYHRKSFHLKNQLKIDF
jgi:ribonuclease HII